MKTEKTFKTVLVSLIRPVCLTIIISLFIFLLSLLGKNSHYFAFWGDPANGILALEPAGSIRSTENFHWSFIVIFAIIVYIYFTELKNKNYKGIVAALSLYGVHWIYEIVNALFLSQTKHALWTVSSQRTSFILLIGVSWELSMMFAIAGLAMSKLLPDDPKKQIFGMNNRIFFAIMNAAFFAIFEIFLAGTQAFIWTYTWWGAIPVFITTYIPFFLAAFIVPDQSPKIQKFFLSITWGLVFILLVVLIPLGVI